MDIRLGSKGNIRFKHHPVGSFANPAWPTAAELNAGQDLEGVTVWDSFEFGAQASETSESATIDVKSTVAARAASQFGGSATFLYPGDHTDMVNLASLVLALFKEVNQPGYISMSIDGDIGEPGQPPFDFSYEEGDYVSLFQVLTDSWEDMITGEERFTYSRDFIRDGFMRTYTVVGSAAPVLTSSSGTAVSLSSTNKFVGVDVLANGRDWTRGCRFTSSDPAVAIAHAGGLIERVSAGTATITATVPHASANLEFEVTSA